MKMSIIERIIFWVAILFLVVALIGERMKISKLEAQAEKMKNVPQVYVGESDSEDSGDSEDSDDNEDDEDGDEDSDEDSDSGDKEDSDSDDSEDSDESDSDDESDNSTEGSKGGN